MATNFDNRIRLLHDLAEKVGTVGCEAHRWSRDHPAQLGDNFALGGDQASPLASWRSHHSRKRHFQMTDD